MKQLVRAKVLTKIAKAKNPVYVVHFRKVDTSVRRMVAQDGIQLNLKGGVNNAERDDTNYHTTFDIEKDEYRVVNLSTVFKLEVDGEEYDVID